MSHNSCVAYLMGCKTICGFAGEHRHDARNYDAERAQNAAKERRNPQSTRKMAAHQNGWLGQSKTVVLDNGGGAAFACHPVDRMKPMTDSGDLAIPDDYGHLLESLKERVRSAQTQARRTVNTQLISLYWSIGRDILTRLEMDGWGSGVIGRLAQDLHTEFPDMKGLSRSNLQYMRSFADAWPAFDPNVPQLWDICRGATSERF